MCKWDGGGFVHHYLWKPDAVKDDAVAKLTGNKLEDNSEYCPSWGDPRNPEKEQKSATPIDNAQAVGRTGIETLAEATSALGYLFDINSNNPTEEPKENPFRRRIKSKKKKQN